MNVRRYIREFGIAIGAILFSCLAWAQGISAVPTIVESHGRGDAATVQGLSVAMSRSDGVEVDSGFPFKLEFFDPTGKFVSGTILETNVPPAKPPKKGDGTKLTFDVPKGAQAPGSKVVIPRLGLPKEAVTLKWRQGTGHTGKPRVGVVPTVITPGPPNPIGGGPQHWSIDPSNPVEINFAGQPSAVIDSGFDLVFSQSQGNEFSVFVAGHESFIRLRDGSYLYWPDDGMFGMIDVADGAVSGLFDFTAIGLAGDWSFDPLTHITRFRATSTSSFDAAAIQTVAEPSTFILLLTALTLIGALSRRVPFQRPSRDCESA